MSTVKGKSERQNFYSDNYKLVPVFEAHKKCMVFFFFRIQHNEIKLVLEVPLWNTSIIQ